MHLTFKHCGHCDAWGKARLAKHPMLQRMTDLQNEGREVTMKWDDCTVCVGYGAEKNTRVTVECEFDNPYEMVK